ncbi:hypothetical protein E4U43_000488 [Claviceps pusilla]|uniref:Uncharacterized protein n=1 Tax=Claviceps pusilla TaxID=123648 RepID=A0A9P7T042_9HYPO|nr:hypothetical protein E4U43_000488 [Claviceps pusilla]
MDPIEIQKACMVGMILKRLLLTDNTLTYPLLQADLGRQRQDELPLSEREGKRPSYEPSRRNGTGHYAPSLKKGLESKWKVHIQDEESAAMQGLAVDDSRPWAKITETYMSRHHADTEPPLVRQNLHHGAADKVPPLPEQPRSMYKPQLRAKIGPEPASRPATKNPQVSSDHNQKQTIKVTESAPTKTSLPIRSRPLVSEQVVYNGLCKWLDPESEEPLFDVKLSLKIQINSDKAFLALSTLNKEDKLHNVLELSAPDIRDDCCRLYSREMASRSRYILQFPNASSAEKFGLYLESLQKAAARALRPRKNTDNQPTKTEIPSSYRPLLSPAEVESMPNACNPVKRDDCETKLVDVESPSTSEQEKKAPTIEDAADSLFNLIETILPEAAAAGLKVSEDAISDIQETAIESWLERGFLKSETDDMKSELLELLRILVRIKRKAEARKKVTRPESLKGFESPVCSAKRIKYSVSEIQNLCSGSTAAPGGLNRYSPDAAATVMSSNKASLDGNSALQKPDATTATPPLSSEKSTSMANKASPAAPKTANKGGILPLQSRSAVKGLGTSR